ncbi:F-box only protein 7-like isoform X2 [Thalassophryne amazonica]|uniref:F-box only protein 7-like isoform X2 n=1 Tax=Thalassophryne amazonica TaxID=390379 RepID=UPI001472251F|nr:F-box only protein 7-like isoform X2 [Thalassophryne amazonica]
MKLRIRINKQTSRVDLQGEDPTIQELTDQIRNSVLPTHGLSVDTKFRLSLNGSELLLDTGQTLSSCSIVRGDLISVILLEPVTAAPSSSQQNSCSSAFSQDRTHQNSAMSSQDQPTSSSADWNLVESDGTEENPGPSFPSWEPMLCSEAVEGQAPHSLELLYRGTLITSPTDALVVTTNLLMLETGFIPQACELKPGEMPAGWRAAGGMYKLEYTHPLCDSSLAVLRAITMGPILVINATLKVNESVGRIPKLCLNASSYVTQDWPGGSAATAFKDLSKLSRVFKDKLAYPLIFAARDAMALPVVFGLAALPPELLLRILRLLDVVSLVRLSSVSRHLRSATDDDVLWRHLYRRDFPDLSSSRDTNWKEFYKRMHKLYHQSRHRRTIFPPLLPFVNNFHVPFHPPENVIPPVPGIIGGEYDLRPNILPRILPRPRYDPIGPFGQPNPERRLNSIRRLGTPSVNVRRGFI